MEENKSQFDENDVRIWEKIIDVQQHFNDIKAKNQTICISILPAAFIASGYLYENDCSLYPLPILIAAFLTFIFGFLDYTVFQKLLEGAVKCGKDFENEHLEPLTSVKIDDYVKKHPTFGIQEARHKTLIFYILIALILLVLWVVLQFLIKLS